MISLFTLILAFMFQHVTPFDIQGGPIGHSTTITQPVVNDFPGGPIG